MLNLNADDGDDDDDDDGDDHNNLLFFITLVLVYTICSLNAYFYIILYKLPKASSS